MRPVVLALSLLACSGESVDHDRQPLCPVVLEGTFIAHYTERNGGSCGVPEDGPVTFSEGTAQGCELTSESVSGCSLTRSWVCVDPFGIRGTNTTTYSPADPDILAVQTVTMTLPSGVELCRSTYDIVYGAQ